MVPNENLQCKHLSRDTARASQATPILFGANRLARSDRKRFADVPAGSGDLLTAPPA